MLSMTLRINEKEDYKRLQVYKKYGIRLQTSDDRLLTFLMMCVGCFQFGHFNFSIGGNGYKFNGF